MNAEEPPLGALVVAGAALPVEVVLGKPGIEVDEQVDEDILVSVLSMTVVVEVEYMVVLISAVLTTTVTRVPEIVMTVEVARE